MIAWLAVVLGINSTHNAGNFTLLLCNSYTMGSRGISE